MQHDQHRKVERQDPPEEAAIPVISMDYCLLGNMRTAAKDNLILVVFDNRTQSLGAWNVFKKGAIDLMGIEVSMWIDPLGYKYQRIATKSDNEVSMVARKDSVSEARLDPTVPFVGLARENKSNGAMETRVKAWQSKFRTLILDLERCIGGKCSFGNSVITWLVVWAATNLNTYRLDTSGTVFYRVTGGHQRRPIANIGECSWCLPNGPRDPGTKAEPRTRDGIYLGIRKQSSESFIATENKIPCATAFRRVPADKKVEDRNGTWDQMVCTWKLQHVCGAL